LNWRRFSIADEVEKIVGSSLKQAERLRMSILKRAFEGKLVPQDPDDEPAEKLLERIKKEKRTKLKEVMLNGEKLTRMV
jgi:type I restriction enzyme S subunit